MQETYDMHIQIYPDKRHLIYPDKRHFKDGVPITSLGEYRVQTLFFPRTVSYKINTYMIYACKKSLLKLTCIKRTSVYSEHNSWLKWILFRQGSRYALFLHPEALSTVLWFSLSLH
jgi:hypothetical protein